MQANLLRMRGRWEEAVQRCAEALQQQPSNASAHSLLGDIYENRGRLEEAIQWYQLALDLDPASAADQAKLARARERLAARGRSTASGEFARRYASNPPLKHTAPEGRGRSAGGETAGSPAGRGGETPGGAFGARCETRGSRGAAAISWLRVATVTGVAFCCTILALAIVFSASERREGLLRAPVTDLRGRQARGFPFWGRGHAPARGAGRLDPGAPERSEAGNTPRELQLLAELRGVSVPTGIPSPQSLRPDDVRLDPRTASAEITASLAADDDRPSPAPNSDLLSPSPPAHDRPPGQETVVGVRPAPSAPWRAQGPRSAVALEREAYRLAARLVQADHSLALIHVRVLVPLADPSDRQVSELALVATLESAALTADPDRLTDADLQNLFRSAWWAPPMR
jgi:Tetratricopeptide repeat